MSKPRPSRRPFRGLPTGCTHSLVHNRINCSFTTLPAGDTPQNQHRRASPQHGMADHDSNDNGNRSIWNTVDQHSKDNRSQGTVVVKEGLEVTQSGPDEIQTNSTLTYTAIITNHGAHSISTRANSGVTSARVGRTSDCRVRLVAPPTALVSQSLSKAVF